MAVTMAKFINSTMTKYGTIQECYFDNEIDSVLIPDEFLDEERIQEVLNATTDLAWAHVNANKKKYSPRIRMMIDRKDFRPSSKIKMIVREMTDKDIENIRKERMASKMKEFDDKWEEIRKTLPARPMDDLDDAYDDAWQSLSAARDRMTAYLSKKNGRYVPPSARKNVDPEEVAIEKDINECKKEFEETEKRISEAEDKYWEVKKNECFQDWLCQV